MWNVLKLFSWSPSINFASLIFCCRAKRRQRKEGGTGEKRVGFCSLWPLDKYTNPGTISDGIEPAGSKSDLIYCNLHREFSPLFRQPWFLQGKMAPDKMLALYKGVIS